MEELVNAFNSEENINENELNQNNDPLQIKYEQFENKKVINYFQQIKLIKQSIPYHISLSNMKLVENEQYIDKYCWRCKSNAPKHDNKINIRTESLFEGLRIPLNGLYFLIYHCFLNNYSKNKSYQEMLKFSGKY